MLAKTKKEYTVYFKAEILPMIKEAYEQDGQADYVARAEAWNDDIDGLVRDRQLPSRARDWCCPSDIDRR